MDISLDSFFNGKIKIYQPKKGYRAGIDSVLLASCIKTSKDCKIYDVGSGVGTISFCLGYRCNNITIIGIEKNFEYYSLALKSFKLNKFDSRISFLNKDFKKIKNLNCDIIVSNPPWFAKNTTYLSPNTLSNEAKVESIDLNSWIGNVYSNLKYDGEYYTIFPYHRINELIKYLKIHFGIVKIYPISSFKSEFSDRAIVYAKKTIQHFVYKEYDKIIIHKKDKDFEDNISNILKKGSSLLLE